MKNKIKRCIPPFCHHHHVEPKWYTNTQQHKWGMTNSICHKINFSRHLQYVRHWLDGSRHYCAVLDETSCHFPVSCPVLPAAYSCIVCLHRAVLQKPSLTLQGLEFSLIYRHQSLFVWMSYGLTLLVCSFVVITKASTVTGNLPRNCHTANSLFHKGFQEVALHTANAPISQQPHSLQSCKPDNPSGPRGSSVEFNQKPWTQTWGFQRDLEYVFLTLIHRVYISLA